MNFSLHKGTNLVNQISDKESDAVKIAAQNLETDIQKVISGIRITKSGQAVFCP